MTPHLLTCAFYVKITAERSVHMHSVSHVVFLLRERLTANKPSFLHAFISSSALFVESHQVCEACYWYHVTQYRLLLVGCLVTLPAEWWGICQIPTGKKSNIHKGETPSGAVVLQLVLGWTKAGEENPEPNLLQIRHQVAGTATQLCPPAFPGAVLFPEVLDSKPLGLISTTEGDVLILREASTSLFFSV